MYQVAFKCGYRVFRLGISQPSFASIKQHNLGLHLGHIGAPLHTCSARSRLLWQRPLSSLLTQSTTRQLQQQQHAPLLFSRVASAGLSSLTTASELSAAIAAAPTAAALQGLAAAAATQQGWLVQQYKVHLLPRLEAEPPVGLVRALLFFARTGSGHVDLFERSVPVLYNQLGQLTPRDLLDLLSAYSAAAQHSPAAYSQELYAALTEFLWEGLNELDARGLADIAEGYAAVDHYDDDEDFFGGVAAAALHRLESFYPEDLSRLMSGLSRLRFAAPDLSAAALRQMCAQLESWPLSCIGRLLAALAAVQAPCLDPCLLEKVANHVSNTLRNLRTSTDGKQLLASLGQIGSSNNSSSSNGAAATAATAAAAAGAGAGGAGGRDRASSGAAAAVGGSLSGLSGSNTRLGPTWQGFGMTRSSSTDSSSSGAGDGSSSAGAGAGAGVIDGAASIWAAANSSSGLYEYSEPAAGGGPAPGVTHVLDNQECELGPDYITVTSYGTDGRVTTTYIKKPAAGSSLGLDTIGRGSAPNSSSSSSTGTGGVAGYRAATVGNNSSSSSSNGTKLPPGTRALATSSRGWALRGAGSSTSSSNGTGLNNTTINTNTTSSNTEEGCPTSWEWQTISSDCRPVYDDASALQGALVDIVWAFAMLGHLHSNMAKECFKALALVAPEGVAEGDLVRLWSAHMRYQQLGHVMLDPNPLLAESYSVFAREVSRAAPRTLSLPPSLQTLAASEWLMNCIRQAPEYEQQQQQQDQQQQQQQVPAAAAAPLSSWKYRDPAVLTQQGLEASVRQALQQQLGLPVGSPCVTLDGLERVGMPLKHNGVCIAWQVLPPSWCSRNPPHSPTAEAQAHRWALQYRGYTVLQVPFNEWASVLESGDSLVQAGYLQNLLDSVASVRAPHVPNF